MTDETHNSINNHFRQQLGIVTPAPEVPEPFVEAARRAGARDVTDLYQIVTMYTEGNPDIDPMDLIGPLRGDRPELFMVGEGVSDAGRQGDPIKAQPDVNAMLRQLAGRG